VTVVATATREGLHASTANSFTSVSLEPRLVLVCLSGASRTLAALLEAGVFSVNVLTEGQEEVARRFADPCRPAGSGALAGIAALADVRWSRWPRRRRSSARSPSAQRR